MKVSRERSRSISALIDRPSLNVAAHLRSSHTVRAPMNDTTQSDASVSAPAIPLPVSRTPHRSVVPHIGFALALLALLGLAWQWYDSRTAVDALRQELAKKLADADALNKGS